MVRTQVSRLLGLTTNTGEMKTNLIIGGAFVLLIGGALVYDFIKGTGFAGLHVDQVFIDNNSPTAVDIELTGGSTESCSLPAYASCVIRIDAEVQYTAVTQAEGQEMQRSTFALPASEYGSSALYVIGPSRPYAIATVGYGNYQSSTTLLEPTAPFTLINGRISGDTINAPFPDSTSTSGTGTTFTHLCHFDPQTQLVGCP